MEKHSEKRSLNWFNIFFFSLTPFVALVGIIGYTWQCGLVAGNFILFGAMLVTSLLGISAGYHRYFSHRTYQCNRILQLFYLIFGASTFEMSALDWSADHRNHHRFVDQDEDPYDVMRGFFWAHVGWLFYKNPPTRTIDNCQDLQANPLVMWQHRWFVPLAIGVGFVLPTLIGWMYGHPWGGLLWGGLVRMVFFHQVTFFINSAAHYFGTQPYSKKNSSRDHWILAILTFGEGYHNFHHAFQGDYRNGYRWYHFDPSKWWIKAFSWIGWTWELNRMPDWAIMKARIEIKALTMQPWLENQPIEWRVKLSEYLQIKRECVESMLSQFREVWKEYQHWAYQARVNATEDHQLRAEWLQKIRSAKRASAKAVREYKRGLQRMVVDSASVVEKIVKERVRST